jgi:DNA processing protein
MTQSESQAALAWLGLPRVGERTLLALMDHAREARTTLATLWQASPDDLAQLVPLHPRTLETLRTDPESAWSRAGEDLEAARSRGVELLLAGAPDLPPALREAGACGGRRWPVIFAYGALGLLDEPRVAIVNSREVSPAGLAATDGLADALARRDLALVASTNREAYRAAATAAKRHAGPAVLVLDRGIAEAFPHGLDREPVAAARVWDESFDPDLQLLLSPFAWRDHWTARNGKRRDALLFDLSGLVVAVDVRADGYIQQECRRALRRGKPVWALDRGAETEPGTRALWEEAPDGAPPARRVAWSGGEAAAREIAAALPGPATGSASDRPLEGWLREVSLFIGRLAVGLGGRRASIQGYPAGGPFTRAAGMWGAPGSDGTTGADILLADLWSSEPATPARLTQLLRRVAAGGLVAALVPAAWLDGAEHAGGRGAWLEGASLRLSARIPELPGGAERRPAGGAAVVVLERMPSSERRALSFAPDRPVMGRFHLRRYLSEVLLAVDTVAGRRSG